jgi:hypothetical protein
VSLFDVKGASFELKAVCERRRRARRKAVCDGKMASRRRASRLERRRGIIMGRLRVM